MHELSLDIFLKRVIHYTAGRKLKKLDGHVSGSNLSYRHSYTVNGVFAPFDTLDFDYSDSIGHIKSHGDFMTGTGSDWRDYIFSLSTWWMDDSQILKKEFRSIDPNMSNATSGGDKQIRTVCADVYGLTCIKNRYYPLFTTRTQIEMPYEPFCKYPFLDGIREFFATDRSELFQKGYGEINTANEAVNVKQVFWFESLNKTALLLCKKVLSNQECISALSQEYSQLGIFGGKRKKEIEKEIDGLLEISFLLIGKLCLEELVAESGQTVGKGYGEVVYGEDLRRLDGILAELNALLETQSGELKRLGFTAFARRKELSADIRKTQRAVRMMTSLIEESRERARQVDVCIQQLNERVQQYLS